MVTKNFISRNIIITTLFLFIFIIGFFFGTISIFASDSISPESVELYTSGITDNTQNAESTQNHEDIFIKVKNSPSLSSKTIVLENELISNEDALKYTSLQIQSKIDSNPWKTDKLEDFEYINPKEKESVIKIGDTSKINLNSHTLYIKVRYAWVTEKGSIYYDTWSCVSVIGKDADSIAFPDEIADAPVFSDVSIEINEKETPIINTSFKNFPEVITTNINNPTGTLIMNIMISENDGEFRNVRFQPVSTIEPEKILQSSILDKNKEYQSGTVKIKARYEWYKGGASYYGINEPDVVSPWSDEVTKEIELWSNASKWALSSLNSAKELNLFPACLMGKDLKKQITRLEFAAAAVKLYEIASNTSADAPKDSPFTDCDDTNVSKAYSLGFINGISKTSYAPDTNITREQAAVILTRVYKLITDKNWVLESDDEYNLEYDNSQKFADDYLISNYAISSVYFMENNKIIEGIGHNKFAPNNKIIEYSKNNLGNATREQAMVIILRMIDKFS